MVIAGIRQSGKSLDLIREVFDNNGVIVTYNSDHANNIKQRAKDILGLEIRQPLSIESLIDDTIRKTLLDQGLLKEDDKIYIEESEYVLSKLFTKMFNLDFSGMVISGSPTFGLILKEVDNIEERIDFAKKAGIHEREYTVYKTLEEYHKSK